MVTWKVMRLIYSLPIVVTSLVGGGLVVGFSIARLANKKILYLWAAITGNPTSKPLHPIAENSV